MQFILNTFGLLSAALGILIHLPDKNKTLRPTQIGANELSWFPALLGVVTAVGGMLVHPRRWGAIIMGSIGVGLSMIPFLPYSAAAKDMDSAMRAGLGRDYEAEIPAAVKARLAESIWSFENALGKRERIALAWLTQQIPYTSVNGKTLTLDVYEPTCEPAIGEQYPALIVIHGGGWRNGERGGWFAARNRYYASQGYVVFDIEYRLSGIAKWPAQHDDVQTAIRWVKARADDYHIDPERIAVMGRSAGAHLALMAGYCSGHDTQVRAVVSIYAPIELRWPNLKADSAIVGLLGGTFEDAPDAYENATPLNYVRDGLPPTLIIEGGMDTITPYYHGDALSNRFSLTDTPFALLRAPWSRHGFDAVLSGLGAQLVQYHIDRFLAWSLYRETSL